MAGQDVTINGGEAIRTITGLFRPRSGEVPAEDSAAGDPDAVAAGRARIDGVVADVREQADGAIRRGRNFLGDIGRAIGIGDDDEEPAAEDAAAEAGETVLGAAEIYIGDSAPAADDTADEIVITDRSATADLQAGISPTLGLDLSGIGLSDELMPGVSPIAGLNLDGLNTDLASFSGSIDLSDAATGLGMATRGLRTSWDSVAGIVTDVAGQALEAGQTAVTSLADLTGKLTEMLAASGADRTALHTELKQMFEGATDEVRLGLQRELGRLYDTPNADTTAVLNTASMLGIRPGAIADNADTLQMAYGETVQRPAAPGGMA